MKNVLVISSTMRKGGNSEILAKEFANGAKDVGNNVEFISLKDKKIEFCKGCMSCVTSNNCVINDDATVIMQKVRNCDVLVFATPIYYYEMSGQLKTLIDRCNPNFSADYQFRKVYLIASAAEGDRMAMDGAIKGVQGFVDCFEKCEFSDVIYGIGLSNIGDAQKQNEILKEAYAIGRRV